MERPLARLARIGLALGLSAPLSAADPPNVLLLAVDDLNDWIGCLEGHPQVRTPNIDRLAARGVLFTNAHCQAPVCNPSRASLLSGLYPESTGIYFLTPPLWESEVVDEEELLPQRFARAGYEVAAGGKLFHSGGNARFFEDYAGNFGGFGPFPPEKLAPFPGHRLWDWGAFPARDEDLPDHALASWASTWLAREHESPFLLCVGFVTPHVPQYAPAAWIERHPADSVVLPATKADDLADVPRYGVDLTRREHVAPSHTWVEEQEQWVPLVQTYLACVAFVDAQIGRVLDALDAGPHADDTVVVLFSDHGFHLGEKQRWAKRSLWHESTRVPLVVAGPDVVEGGTSDAPVELVALFPTLLDLTGLDHAAHLEGQSLRPLLQDPGAPWTHVARSSFGPGNVALVSRTHRYIRYRDGSEELYDFGRDPHEWTNLASRPEQAELLGRFRHQLPLSLHEPLGRDSTGHRAFAAANAADAARSKR